MYSNKFCLVLYKDIKEENIKIDNKGQYLNFREYGGYVLKCCI